MRNNLVSCLAAVALSHEEDEFTWNLDSTGVFSIKSHYRGLINQNVSNVNQILWKFSTPLKIKIFLWYLRCGVILTKDNLPKRNYRGNQSVFSIMKIKQYSICFLTAILHGWLGLRCMQHGAYPNLAIFQIFSGAGLMEYLKISNL